MNNCTYCQAPAHYEEGITPPMCERHLDAAMIAERLSDLGKQVSPTNAQALYRKAQARGGQFTITEQEIGLLLNEIAQAVN